MNSSSLFIVQLVPRSLSLRGIFLLRLNPEAENQSKGQQQIICLAINYIPIFEDKILAFQNLNSLSTLFIRALQYDDN